MLPTVPAIRTSASHAIAVLLSCSLRLNCVTRFISAPTPVPLAWSRENSGGRSSSFSNLIDILSDPRPSGILTFAFQRLSSSTSKLST
jgi:hypothetical protein